MEYIVHGSKICWLFCKKVTYWYFGAQFVKPEPSPVTPVHDQDSLLMS